MSISSPKDEPVSPGIASPPIENLSIITITIPEEEIPPAVKETPPPPQTAIIDEPPRLDTMIVTKKLCGVCIDKPSRYKCSRCYLPYCSIACSILHKATHPTTEPTLPLPPKPTDKPPKTSTARVGTLAAAGQAAPFAALEKSNDLKLLFRLYPRLPVLLEEIHTTTLQPVLGQEEGNGHRNGRRREEQWNSDRGMAKGVQALNKARNSDGKDGESLREYSRLVLQILAADDEVSAAEQLQREVAEADRRFVKELLDGER